MFPIKRIQDGEQNFAQWFAERCRDLDPLASFSVNRILPKGHLAMPDFERLDHRVPVLHLSVDIGHASSGKVI